MYAILYQYMSGSYQKHLPGLPCLQAWYQTKRDYCAVIVLRILSIPSDDGFLPIAIVIHSDTPSEWFMAVGASMGYEHANAKALDLWHQIYGTDNLIALTDTFTTEAFFQVCAPACFLLPQNHSDAAMIWSRTSLLIEHGYGEASARTAVILSYSHLAPRRCTKALG